MGAAEDYNEDPRLNMADAQVRVVCAENRNHEDNEPEGNNTKATFMDSLAC